MNMSLITGILRAKTKLYNAAALRYSKNLISLARFQEVVKLILKHGWFGCLGFLLVFNLMRNENTSGGIASNKSCRISFGPVCKHSFGICQYDFYTSRYDVCGIIEMCVCASEPGPETATATGTALPSSTVLFTVPLLDMDLLHLRNRFLALQPHNDKPN